MGDKANTYITAGSTMVGRRISTKLKIPTKQAPLVSTQLNFKKGTSCSKRFVYEKSNTKSATSATLKTFPQFLKKVNQILRPFVYSRSLKKIFHYGIMSGKNSKKYSYESSTRKTGWFWTFRNFRNAYKGSKFTSLWKSGKKFSEQLASCRKTRWELSASFKFEQI